MRYTNALRGIKTLRAAAVLTICAAALTVFLAVIGLLDPYDRYDDYAVLALSASFALSVAILVVKLVGISQAARDQSKFSDARTVILIGIVLSLLGGLLFRDKGIPGALAELAVSACGLWATILIIQGILAFAELFRYEEMLLEGKRLIRMVWIVESFAMATTLLSDLLPESLGTNLFFLLLTIFSLALRIWELVLYLHYLKDAGEMLTIGNPALGVPGSVSLPHTAHNSNSGPQ